MASFSFSKPFGLWVIYILWPVICVSIYTISQLILVFRTLDDRWPIGDIIFGVAFFTIAQVLLFAFSVTICDAIKHYIDGLFFFTLCMLLSVMMVYKYWDSITVCFPPLTLSSSSFLIFMQKEDLEFSVGSKAAVWEVKDPLLAQSDYNQSEEDTASYHGAGGFAPSLIGGVSGGQLYGNLPKGGHGGGGGGYGGNYGRAYPPAGGGY
jgi:hypothetical protein